MGDITDVSDSTASAPCGCIS